MRSLHRIALVAAMATCACTGEVEDPAAGPRGRAGAASGLIAPEVGLRRLTAHEYDNVLRDLLGDESRPAAALLPRDARTPFDNDETTQSVSQSLIEGVDLLAGDASRRLLADPARRDRVVGCTPSGADDAVCLRSFVTRFGRLALRRPLAEDEVALYMGTQALAVETGDFHVAVETVLRAFLQAPELLYRVEIGAPLEGERDVVRLRPNEVAARLSFLLWESTPDDWLLDLAEADELDSPEAVRAAAETMLLDPRAREVVDRFHALWLGYDTLPHPPELAVAMWAESRALLDRVVFEERRPWQDILRLEETFVDDSLAAHYGLVPPGSEEPVWVPYGDGERAGLLAHGSFLSIGAKHDDTSPTQRGLAIRERLLCQTIPPPPPGVDVDNPIPETEEAVCKWDRFAMHRTGGCAGCHALTDGAGFGLERFDQLGRYRTVEAAHPECAIEGRGEIVGVGEFHGPAELGELLITADLVNPCLTMQLYRFAIGRRDLDDVDREWIAGLQTMVGPGDFRFDELLLSLVSSEGFVLRRIER